MSATREQATAAGASQIRLDLDLCKACGICIALCPEEVFDRDGLGYPVIARPEECTSCLLCELHCPDFALEVARRPKKRPRAGEAATPEDVAEAHSQKVLEALAGGGAPEGAGAPGHADLGCDDDDIREI
jgi:2-oxoglutarate ferredoxin oxidoreductase subunit delta